MKKEKVILYLTISILCMILMSTIFMRFKSVEETDLNSKQSLIE